ncbi:hypothetical protein V3477_31790, partial [Pseudomonas aeruginosa]
HALARSCRIVTDTGVGKNLTRHHHRLMPGEDRRRTYCDRPNPSAHPRLNDVNMPTTGVVADAEPVLHSNPGRRSRLA